MTWLKLFSLGRSNTDVKKQQQKMLEWFNIQQVFRIYFFFESESW